MKAIRRRSTRSFLPVARIGTDTIELQDGGRRAVLECPTLAFGIKGEAEQRAVVDGWAALLNSLSYPLQVLIRTRRADGTAVAPLPTIGARQDALRQAYKRLLEGLAGERRIVDRRHFVVVPWDPARVRRERAGAGAEALEQRVRWVAECLRRLDLEPRRLGSRELAELLRRSLDPTTARQPIADTDALLDVAELLAPSATVERMGHLEVGERRCRTLAVVRYPARLAAGWLGELSTFDGDLDCALHIAPGAGVAAMAFLERRIAELSSTLRAADERGARSDPYRRAALADALELRDQLAQGSERLFDTTLLFTIWADDAQQLVTLTEGLEALLGTRLIHTRRLQFQMRAGVQATLPLGTATVDVVRPLSTSALAATFPFGGSDLRGHGGLLYGLNRATQSPVVLDRFALENHNAVVFATSGAGKSYLVKVELVRALLSGMRCVVIDPEGEYASLLGAVGAYVIPVHPGAGVGLDPFALTDAAAGSLAVRIGTLTTLVALLVGELTTGERAAVEEAIALAYGQAGYRDGEDVAGRVPPRLGSVLTHLRTRPDLERIVRILERYVSGPQAWLFEAAPQGLPAGADSVVYSLAGLAEETRAAAMFLVLDRVWTRLEHATAPTLVVVDEAWWLMRHADTAGFLFRLVKTARKRRAGLTLVTQDVSDVLSHPDGEAVITNSALQILLRQAPQAMPRLAELFRLTQAEQSFLLGAERGEALLIAQGRRVPLQVVATDEEARLIERRAAVP